jgi:hypothetical protein
MPDPHWKLRRSIRASLDALKEYLKAVTEYTIAKQKPKEPSPPKEPRRVSIIAQFSTDTENRYYAEQNKSYTLQGRIFWATVATGIAVAAYAVITFLQWRTMNETMCEIRKQTTSAGIAANAAKSAAQTAGDTLIKSIEQFRIDERAWIEIDRIERTQVSSRSNEFGAAFRYRLYPRNVGKTAAHSIAINAARSMQTSITLQSNAGNMEREQDQILLKALPKEARDNPVPRVLAPGTTSAVPFVMDGQEPQIFSKDEWVSYLIGRIDYMDEFGVHHWMKFCFYVGEANGTLWNCHEGNDEDHNPEVPPPIEKKR